MEEFALKNNDTTQANMNPNPNMPTSGETRTSSDKAKPVPDKARTSKKNILMIVMVVIAVILLSMLGVILFQIFRTEFAETAETKVGVLVPERVTALNLKKMKTRNISGARIVYKESAEVEANIVESLLKTEALNSMLQDNDGEEIVVVVNNSISNSDVQRSKETDKQYVVEDLQPALISGKYIYLTKDFTKIVERPTNVYQQLYASVLFADLYIGLNLSANSDQLDEQKRYDISQSEVLREYVDKAYSGTSLSNWQVPTQVKNRADYEKYSGLCSALTSPERLYMCETIVYQANGAEKLPVATKEHIAKTTKLKTDSQYVSLTSAYQGYADKLIASLELAKSPISFTAFDLAVFTSATYQEVDSSRHYHQVSDSKLKIIQQTIEEAGWTFVAKSEVVQDNQFGADQYNLTFERESSLLKAQLVIQVMDTRTLNSDCVVKGVGEVYCREGQSIYKNTDNYVHILVGEYPKYKSVQ